MDKKGGRLSPYTVRQKRVGIIKLGMGRDRTALGERTMPYRGQEKKRCILHIKVKEKIVHR